jgi:hypothetical protein
MLNAPNYLAALAAGALSATAIALGKARDIRAASPAPSIHGVTTPTGGSQWELVAPRHSRECLSDEGGPRGHASVA